MKNLNTVFIAQSLDGYIADKNGGLDWLHAIPNADNNDMGYTALMDRIDAIVMGRKTFETVCAFDCDWPYTKPVFVISNTLTSISEEYKGKVELVKGPVKHVVEDINNKGYSNLYIDGGTTINSFLKEDLIDEMIITTIPVLLGGGTPLFRDLPAEMNFELKESKVFLEAVVQSWYVRRRL